MNHFATTPRRPGGLLRRLLRVPLFYKILIANAALVLTGTFAGAVLTRTFLRTGNDLSLAWMVLLGTTAVLVTILVNGVIVRVALTPLKLLEQTSAQVQAGDLNARVPYSPLRDSELDRLTRTFNAMLDNLEAYRQRLRDVAARALNAEEEERKRIARELHDDTAQSLAALLIRLRLLRGVENPDQRDAALDEFREELGGALERVRRFARGLRPAALDELGLVPALEAHVRALAESIGIAMRVDAEPLDPSLTPQAELALYRIAQEAISNAIRHADAAHVLVRIVREDADVALTVGDDGRGFVIDEVIEGDGRGLGLFGMRERAAYVGGAVTIRSTPGQGTEVHAVVPTAGRAGTLPPRGAAADAGS